MPGQCAQRARILAHAMYVAAMLACVAARGQNTVPDFPGFVMIDDPQQAAAEDEVPAVDSIKPGQYYLDPSVGAEIPPWAPEIGPELQNEQGWNPPDPPPTYSPWLTRLGFRHSYTHGRNVGWGRPLVGTSWLNRPHVAGVALGPMWMTRSLEDSVSRDTDVIGSIYCGWDWDYYWGSEFQFAYATPELRNAEAPDAPHGDRMFHWNYSLMYYPWGDSEIRPYWRLGVGDSKFDFPTDAGNRHDEWLLTFPVGVGIKYPCRRWLAARAEFVDLISVGGNGVASQHNLVLSFGLECHTGARPQSYWPWNPSRHIW
jgi:hypothetical protein